MWAHPRGPRRRVVSSGPATGSSSARLECSVRDREVGSSNLPFPTASCQLRTARQRATGYSASAHCSLLRSRSRWRNGPIPRWTNRSCAGMRSTRRESIITSRPLRTPSATHDVSLGLRRELFASMRTRTSHTCTPPEQHACDDMKAMNSCLACGRSSSHCRASSSMLNSNWPGTVARTMLTSIWRS
jgi:hypothetical protein